VESLLSIDPGTMGYVFGGLFAGSLTVVCYWAYRPFTSWKRQQIRAWQMIPRVRLRLGIGALVVFGSFAGLMFWAGSDHSVRSWIWFVGIVAGMSLFMAFVAPAMGSARTLDHEWDRAVREARNHPRPTSDDQWSRRKRRRKR